MKFRTVLAFLLVLCSWCGRTLAADPVPIPAPVFVVPPKSVPLKFAAPVFDCPNCTQCANGCSCFGSGYYCADGKCPVGFGAPAGYTTVCENGVCRLVPVNGTAGTVAAGQNFFMSSGSCASGSCGAATASGFTTAGACQSAGQSSGWWLGKNLGKQPPPWKR